MLTLSKREELEERYSNQLKVAPELSRQLVSFQASKVQPVYRWFKYKEGFSPNLVKHFLQKYSKKPGKILDPFAGTGTTLFTAMQEGWDAIGIELLPVGAFSIEARKALQHLDINEFEKQVKTVWSRFYKT